MLKTLETTDLKKWPGSATCFELRDLAAKCEWIDQARSNLCLIGKHGVGKSHAARLVAGMVEACRTGLPGLVCDGLPTRQHSGGGFERRSSCKRYLRRLQRFALLVVDELKATFQTAETKEPSCWLHHGSCVRLRAAHERASLLVTSNLASCMSGPKSSEDAFQLMAALLDRLHAGVTATFTSSTDR